jgi:hypothetical protein
MHNISKKKIMYIWLDIIVVVISNFEDIFRTDLRKCNYAIRDFLFYRMSDCISFFYIKREGE